MLGSMFVVGSFAFGHCKPENGAFYMLDPKLEMSCLYQASGLNRPQCIRMPAEDISV